MRTPSPGPASPIPGVFFAVGAARSGTTLLTRLLSAHPHIVLHHERRILELAERTGQLLCPKGTGTEQRAAGRPHALRMLRWRVPETTAWVGDKYPPYATRIPELSDAFPGCRIVHLVRDPRSVVASWFSTWPRSHAWRRGAQVPTAAWIAESWRCSVVAAAEATAALGAGRTLELRYEDLVANPQAAGRRVLDFFEQEDDPAFCAALGEVSVRGHWQRDLSEAEVSAVESVPGVLQAMEGWGYAAAATAHPEPDTAEGWVKQARAAADGEEARRAWLRVLRLQPGHPEASRALQAEPERGEALFGFLHEASPEEGPAAQERLARLLRGRGLAAAAAAAVAEPTP